MLPALSENGTVCLAGFVTVAMPLRSQSTAELESRLGYAPGRLNGGWWLLFLTQMPAPGDFEYRGYSHMSGGIPQGHLRLPGGKTTEQMLRARGFNMRNLKAQTIANTFKLNGHHRLAKLLPVTDPSGPNPYPPGTGIPQWELVKCLRFRVVKLIGPGQMYLGNYE